MCVRAHKAEYIYSLQQSKQEWGEESRSSPSSPNSAVKSSNTLRSFCDTVGRALSSTFSKSRMEISGGCTCAAQLPFLHTLQDIDMHWLAI